MKIKKINILLVCICLLLPMMSHAEEKPSLITSEYTKLYAESLYNKDKQVELLGVLNKFLEKHPHDAAALKERADLNVRLAAADYDTLINLPQTKADKLTWMAFKEGSLGKNYVQQVEFFTQAIKEDSSRTDLYYNRARAYFKLKKYKEALSDAKLALADENCIVPKIVIEKFIRKIENI